MKYLTSMSRTDAMQGSRIQDQILMANPILESFGNATTVMNLNSSRFGKYNEMWFNRVGSLVGAGIKTFLLESSRVVLQQKGEKNYHVFYELLAGMDEDDLEQLCLERERSYKLIHAHKAQPEEGSQEARKLQKQFEDLKQALSIFLDEEAQENLWQVLAALLHLGEVDFIELEAEDELPEPSPSSLSASSCTEPMPSQSAKVEIHPAPRLLCFMPLNSFCMAFHRVFRSLKGVFHVVLWCVRCLTHQLKHHEGHFELD